MRSKYCLMALAAFVASSNLSVEASDVVCESSSDAYIYHLDTLSSERTVKTRTELDGLWKANYRAGETVTVIAPNGAESTIVSIASETGSTVLPFNAGGRWTVVNSAQGRATFTVRYGIFGTQGKGIMGSPIMIVDDTEILDLMNISALGVGSVVTFVGDKELKDDAILPAQYSYTSAGVGLWSIVSSTDVVTVSSQSGSYFIDTMQGGPDRIITERRKYKVAYSGDDWVGAESAASSLTITPPVGTPSYQNFMGTGVAPYTSFKRGDTTVTMVSDSTTRTAVITSELPYGMMVIIR